MRTITALSMVFAVHALQAQTRIDWKQMSPTAAPRYSALGALVYDDLRRESIYFGGWTYWHQYGNETWRWNGSDWQPLSPQTVPPGRAAHAMACDGARGQVLLYGGYDNSFRQIGDTWSWNGYDWLQRNPVHSPGAREYHGMAFDSNRSEVILFGGRNSQNDLTDETWAWDGADWARRLPTVSPGRRFGHAMAHDPIRGQTVLFGGLTTADVLNDTWIWDGSNWRQAQPAHAPLGRFWFGMAYDERLGGVVLFGGRNWFSPNQFLSDTWLWDGTDWQPLTVATTPGGRQSPGMAFDRARRTMVVFGGFLNNDAAMDHQTWTMDVIDLPRTPVTAYLRGSGGTANPPTLSLSVALPATAVAKYSDSAGIRFAGGNPWASIGTWAADPALASGQVTTLKPLQTWIGLKNSDDQGTRFDLRAEVLKNGVSIGAGEARCVDGVTRNADLAKAVSVAFTPISPVPFNGSTDVLSVRILTRIGTDSGGNFCGGHSSAVGLRLYYDSTQRNSNLGF